MRCAGCRSVIKVTQTKGLLFLLHIVLALALSAIYYYYIGVEKSYYDNDTLIYLLIIAFSLFQSAIALIVINIGKWRLLKDLKKDNENE